MVARVIEAIGLLISLFLIVTGFVSFVFALFLAVNPGVLSAALVSALPGGSVMEDAYGTLLVGVINFSLGAIILYFVIRSLRRKKTNRRFEGGLSSSPSA